MDDEIITTPNGLLQCLRMLSEEAASLSLTNTFHALQEAAAICRAEAKARLSGRYSEAALGLLH